MDEFFKLTALYAKSNTAQRRGLNRAKVRFSRDKGGKEKIALVHSAERFAFLLKDLHDAITKRLELIKINKESLSQYEKGKLEEIISFNNGI